MEKLKEEQIMPYYLHKLKLKYKDGTATEIFNASHLINFDYNFSHLLLVLHPPSDLTKEIEVDGERFVPIERLANVVGGKINSKDKRVIGKAKNAIINEIKIGKIQYCMIQKLFEWHFNVFDLPDHLWIDINILK